MLIKYSRNISGWFYFRGLVKCEVILIFGYKLKELLLWVKGKYDGYKVEKFFYIVCMYCYLW